jgi:hypothetical protein
MANPTMTLIASNTVGSGGVASVTFSSIPSTYTDLKLVNSTRSNYAATTDYYKLSINGSTANFSWIQLAGNGSAASSSNGASNNNNTIDGANATSNTFSNDEFYFPNYTSSNNKSYSADGVEENNATAAIQDLYAGLWSNTAAITSLTLAPANGTLFVQYSSFYLYGIKNS